MVGLEEIGVYIAHHMNMIAQCTATRPIMDLCLVAEQKPRLRLHRRWWEHPSLDILGIRAGHVALEGGEQRGTEESEREGDYGRLV